MPKTEPVVFLLDDDSKFVNALSTLLEVHGLATRAFTKVDDFLSSHDPDCPGCLVLDVRMPGVTGLELQNLLAARGILRPIIFLTAHGDIRMSVQAMKAGAVTFLSKPARRAELLAAIQEAIRHDALERQRQREERELDDRLATLTPREREVLDLVVAGKLNKQIALELCTAEKTVKSHRGHIMAKLQVKSTAALVALFSRSRAESATRPKVASAPVVATAREDSQTDTGLDEDVKSGGAHH
jgi:FixJ family two-component response regulator